MFIAPEQAGRVSRFQIEEPVLCEGRREPLRESRNSIERQHEVDHAAGVERVILDRGVEGHHKREPVGVVIVEDADNPVSPALVDCKGTLYALGEPLEPISRKSVTVIARYPLGRELLLDVTLRRHPGQVGDPELEQGSRRGVPDENVPAGVKAA